MKKIEHILLFLLIGISMNLSAQYIISEAVSVTDMDNSYGRKSPRLVMNGDDELLVFWMKTGSNEAIYMSALSDGVFTSPIEIPFGGLNPNLWSGSLGPNMAAFEDHVYVTFEVYGDAIYIVHSSDGGDTWGDPVAAFTPAAGRRATIPTIAVDNDGNPYVAYVNTNSSEADAYYGMVRSSNQGNSFLEEVNVSFVSAGDEVCECCNGHIEIADNGDVYIAFRNNDNNLRDIWMAVSVDGGDTFNSAYDLDETDWTINACPTNGPHFALASNKIISTFYSGSGDEGSGVYYSIFYNEDDSVSATYNLPLSNDESDNQNKAKVAASGDTLAFVWEESFDGSKEIALSINTSGVSEIGLEPFLLTDMDGTQQLPSILFHNGKFHVVYEDSDSGTVMYQEISFGTVGINELDQANFKMSPNPCHSLLTIERVRDEEEILIIRDIRGRRMIEEKIVGFNYTIDVSHLSAGLFFLSLSDKPGNAQKLIIE